MMEKRKIQSSDSNSAARKKVKKTHKKQPVLNTQTQDTKPKKGTATGPSTKALSTNSSAGPQNAAQNFWWHSKKVKTLTRDGTAGAKTKSAKEGKESMKSGSEKGAETNISKKKKLQLKKKRQRKNRLLSKREKDLGQDAQGDSLRRPKTWEESESSAGKQAARAGRESEHSRGKKKAAKSSPDHRASQKVAADLAPAGSDAGVGASQGPQLQKTGGQKEHRKKKVKKFKKGKNVGEVVPSTSVEAPKKPTDAASTVLASLHEKDRNSQEIRQKSSSQGKSDLKEMKKTHVESVSSNWKALLPIVEKSKEVDAKKRGKFGKGKKRDQQTKPSKPDIWFDDVDPSLIKANEHADAEDDVQSETGYNPLIRKDAKDCLTKCLAMDCEMVGTGPNGSQSALARVSVVNQFGACVLDKYVKTREKVTDYRTFVSGIRPNDLKEKGEDFEKVQKEVSDMLKGRIVVGHALQNDFKVLYFTQPRSLIRDTSLYQPFRDLFKSKRPGLKKLTELVLKVKVQKGEHNSVEDAQAAMKLYLLHRKQWEKSLREKRHQHQPKSSAKKPTKTSGKETSLAKV